MYQLLMNGSTVGLLFQVIPVVLVVGGIYALSRFSLCRRKGEHFSHQKIIDCLFVCYLTGLISLILVPNNLWTALWFYIYNGYPGCIIGPLLVPNFNFTPTIFLWLKGEIIPGKWGITMLLLNFLMFLPMGVFLPQEFKGLHNKNIIATAVAISAIIELIQPIIGRSFDVDDIVMNSLGIICGRIIVAVIERKKKK